MNKIPQRLVLDSLQKAKESGMPLLAVLADPDKASLRQLSEWAYRSSQSEVDMLLIGGSLLERERLELCVDALKKAARKPVVLFPGNFLQVTARADALLFLSLISGRNAELLIGQQVAAAHLLKNRPLEIIGTGYVLIDGGRQTSVSYMSQTMPIPGNKPDIAAMTALAGELLGMQLIYLDAGSGAEVPVSVEVIERVREVINIPLIVGGGIRSASDFRAAAHAGADMVVVGTAAEKGSWPENWKSEL
mgnify:CR=1 FL=1